MSIEHLCHKSISIVVDEYPQTLLFGSIPNVVTLSESTMKLHEVLDKVTDHTQWFRPKHWKGHKLAYIILDGRVCRAVPPSHPSHWAHTVGITDDVLALSSEWEIVSPDKVLNGK